MKIFGRSVRYNPGKTAEIRLRAMMCGVALREVARVRVYTVASGHGRPEENQIAYGLFEAIRMRFVPEPGYLFRRPAGSVGGPR